MAKLCPNCAELNGNTSVTCKNCNASLVRAAIVQSPTLFSPGVIIGFIVLLLLLLGALYFFILPLLAEGSLRP